MKRPLKKSVAEGVLTQLLPLADMENLLGDFLEIYASCLKNHQRFQAECFLWSQILRSIPHIFLNSIRWSLVMIQHHLIIAMRNLKKYKGYSFINIAGLAVGMAAFLLILLFVTFELRFDRHFHHFYRIYRINKIGRTNHSDYELAITPSALAPAVMNEIPEAEAVTRLLPARDAVMHFEDQTFVEKNVLWVDAGFVQVFSPTFVLGDSETALNQPDALVLTESAARKYFGSRDPLGQTLTLNEDDFQVTGVVKDGPATSHFQYDILLALPPDSPTRWLGNSDYSYLLLKEGMDASVVAARLKELSEKYIYPQLESRLGMAVAEMRRKGDYSGFRLQPLKEVHFDPSVRIQLLPAMDKAYVWLFSLIAAAIILIACINFTNLASARSVLRAREVGIRKTLGSSRKQLVRQFLGETLVMSAVAAVLALLLVSLCLPGFANLAKKPLNADFLYHGLGWLILPGLTLLTGLTAGLYPALFLSSFRPVKVLKSSLDIKGKRSLFRNGLVIFQFSVTIILATSSLIISRQMDYLQKKSLGFNREHLLIIKNCHSVEALTPLINQLKQLPGITSVTNSTSIPGSETGDRTYWIEGRVENRIRIQNFWADETFASTYQIGMTGGRFFDPAFASDDQAVVINAMAARELGVDNPVGAFLMNRNSQTGEPEQYKIIGVLDDIHMRSLHDKIMPLAIYSKPAEYQARYVSLRFAPAQLTDVLTHIQSVWKKYAGDQPLEYTFFDDDFLRHYQAEMRTGRIFTVFTLLAMIVACMGLFGLTSFTTSMRMKEIGIRKVLGAKTRQLFGLLVLEIMAWIAISVAIGWPVTYFWMSRWLENFAYRTPMPWEVFLMAAGLAGLSALLTVSWHTGRAARMNPVNTLKYE